MRLSIIVALFVVASCGESKQEGASAPPSSAKVTAPESAVATPGTAKNNAKRPAAKPISKSEARQRLDAWLAAQNDGDFDSYANQYASDLVGIKRVGERRSEFDRAGWLADRKRMFNKKMVVKASDVDLQVDGRPVHVVFTQTWSSGSFQDKGPKRLTLAREGNKVVIAREEMLSSKVDDSQDHERDAIRAIDKKLAKVKAESFEMNVGSEGNTCFVRRYRVDGKTLKVYVDYSMVDRLEELTIYFRDGKPFHVSYSSEEGDHGDHNDDGISRAIAVRQAFTLAGARITSAWMRIKTFQVEFDFGGFEGLAPGARDKLMATTPKVLTQVIGDGAWSKKLADIGVLLRDSKDPAEAYVEADNLDFLSLAESK